MSKIAQPTVAQGLFGLLYICNGCYYCAYRYFWQIYPGPYIARGLTGFTWTPLFVNPPFSWTPLWTPLSRKFDPHPISTHIHPSPSILALCKSRPLIRNDTIMVVRWRLSPQINRNIFSNQLYTMFYLWLYRFLRCIVTCHIVLTIIQLSMHPYYIIIIEYIWI